jgi:hypothetical protein
MQVRFVDWTHPDARDYLRRRIHYLLSPEPGGLNADWLCVHNNHVPDPRQWKFHDPHFRVAQFALTIVRGRGRRYSAFGSWED